MSTQEKKPFSVSEYIEFLNTTLQASKGDIVGEVSEMKIAPSGHVYFTLKDADTGDILSCALWKSRYAMCGVELETGMEVLVKGAPNYTGRFGRMSFIVDSIELVGEGALKKAYEKLKKKLAAEGVFAPERKRSIPLFPKKIGVITSVHGEVIHDFNNNLRKSGYQVKILDSRVEGPESGRSLIFATRAMKKEDIDVLVIMRGGGSMHSLAGFDNEVLVREIVSFPVPVVAGVGHHQDVPLVALAADVAESTPSLIATLLNQSWYDAVHSLERSQGRVFNGYESILRKASEELSEVFDRTKNAFDDILSRYEEVKQNVYQAFDILDSKIENIYEALTDTGSFLVDALATVLDDTHSEYFVRIPKQILNIYKITIRKSQEKFVMLSRFIQTNDPRRQLRLGYSIVSSSGKVIRTTKGVEAGQQLDIQVSDGSILSEVKKLK